MPGTNVWSMVFALCAMVLMAILFPLLANMWGRHARDVQRALEKDAPVPSSIGPLMISIVTVSSYILLATLGWNSMVNVTTSTSIKYVNPSATQEQKKVMESQLPSTEELEDVRSEQKERQQTKPHKEALRSFDEAMKTEAEKIKRRSLSPTE